MNSNEIVQTVRKMTLKEIRSEMSIFKKYGVDVPKVLMDEYKTREEYLNKSINMDRLVEKHVFNHRPDIGFEMELQKWISDVESKGWKCMNQTFPVSNWNKDTASVEVTFKKL